MTFIRTILVTAVVGIPVVALAGGTHAFDKGMQPILQNYRKPPTTDLSNKR